VWRVLSYSLIFGPLEGLDAVSNDSLSVGEWLVGGSGPWVPVVSDGFGSGLLVSEGGLDIFRKTIGFWVWVLLDLGLVRLEPVGVPASGGGTDWVGLNIGLETHPLGVLVVHLVLDEVEVDLGVGHFTLELWRVVVEGLLGWVEWWLLENEVPVVTNDLLGDWEVFVVLDDVGVLITPVGNWVVHVVTWVLLWVLVLTASSRGADWITGSISLDEGPWLVLVAEFTFDEIEVGGGVVHVSVKFWGVVVIGLLGWVLPLGLGLVGSHNEFVLEHTLSNGEIFVSSEDVSVDTKIWDWIILIITSFLLLVLILVAAR